MTDSTAHPRILFAGTPEFAAIQLRALLANPASVVGVLAQPDRPSGRGLKVRRQPVSALAAEAGLPLLQPTKLDESALKQIADLQPNLLLVAAYGLLLPGKLLQLPALGCINVHASLLPKYRGAAPVQHALLAGDSRTGISFMLMDKGLDTGPVLRQHALDIRNDWDAGELTEQLARLGARHLPALIAARLDGSLQPQPQVEALATSAPAVRPADARLLWHSEAAHLQRMVRAYAPRPGAWCLAGGRQRLKVLAARALPTPSGTPADRGGGRLFSPAKGRLAVVCGPDDDGALELLRLQPEGGRLLAAADVLNGRRKELLPGALLS